MREFYPFVGAVVWYIVCELIMERMHRRNNMNSCNFWIRWIQSLGALALVVAATLMLLAKEHG